jgi:salicylate hydroxylase
LLTDDKQCLDRLAISEEFFGMKIQLHFVVVGAGVAGLSCAIALRRIGHRVTVIERKHNVTGLQVSVHALRCLNQPYIGTKHQRGVRMPPNLTKILFHWGLKERVRAISVKSEAVDIMIGMFDFAAGNIA